MEEWKEYKIGDTSIMLIDGDRGKNYPSQNEFSPIGYCLFLNAGNVTKDGFSFENNSFITKEKDCLLRNGKLQRGDVVLTTRGTVGNVALYKDSVPYEHMRINSGMLIVRGGGDLNSVYLYYYIKSQLFQNQILQMKTGSAQPQLPKSTVSNMIISYPESLHTQQKIANILSSLDDKIEVNRRINAELEELAQALFKSWLQNAREERSIGDMCDNILDYSPCPYNEVVLINSSDVTKGLFEHHEYSANSDLKGHFKKRFKKKDILYSEIRPRNQHYAYCLFDADKYIASTRLMILRNKQGIVSSSILYSYLLLDSVLEEFTLKTETRSGTFPQGKFEDMAQIKLPYYPIEEQSEMTDLLDFVYDKIWINQQEITHLTALRDTLLPKLMSGEIDVNK